MPTVLCLSWASKAHQGCHFPLPWPTLPSTRRNRKSGAMGNLSLCAAWLWIWGLNRFEICSSHSVVHPHLWFLPDLKSWAWFREDGATGVLWRVVSEPTLDIPSVILYICWWDRFHCVAQASLKSRSSWFHPLSACTATCTLSILQLRRSPSLSTLASLQQLPALGCALTQHSH